MGIIALPTPTVNGPDTLYQFVEVVNESITHLGAELFSWDASKGKYLSHTPFVLPVFANTNITVSRGGITYFVGTGFPIDQSLVPFSISDFTDDAAGVIPASRFGSTFLFTIFQLDEQVDVLLATNGEEELNIYQLSNGKFLTTIFLPDNIIAMGLQNTNCVYCLCENRMLVLVDYVQGKILGAVKIPPSTVTGTDFNSETSINIFWYARYQRLLISELVPDVVAGVDSTLILGYSPSPVATRLTTPIPLKEPLTGRSIPILTMLVDDSNFGIAGALVGAIVSGDDGTTTIANGIYTDTRGRANIPAQCGDEVATIAIDCTATV